MFGGSTSSSKQLGSHVWLVDLPRLWVLIKNSSCLFLVIGLTSESPVRLSFMTHSAAWFTVIIFRIILKHRWTINRCISSPSSPRRSPAAHGVRGCSRRHLPLAATKTGGGWWRRSALEALIWCQHDKWIMVTVRISA